ncbi:MAG: glycosyltransferase family 4 protein [Solirubrobacteraceae bacterium]
MRVLVTMPWGERLGGAEAMLQSVLDGALAGGHDFELVFFEPGPWTQELRAAGLRVEVIEAGRLHQAHRWAATVARLARTMRSRRPDVILNWSAKTQLYGAPAATLAGMRDRVVWWQHSIPTGEWLDSVATRLPTVAVGCYSRAGAEAQKRLRPSRRTFIVAAATPIPLPDPGAPPPLKLPTGMPVVGMVGRLEPWKGQDRLLHAQALLRERGHEFHLVLVGGDAYNLSEEYAASLPSLVSRLGLEDSVSLTGQVRDAGPYIEQMDILVNASDPEPFGIVLLEGMARGVPVVAVESGGPAEFIDDRRTGLFARSGEPADLAEPIEELLRSAQLREKIGAAGRERYTSEFTEEAMRGRFFAELQRLIDARESR